MASNNTHFEIVVPTTMTPDEKAFFQAMGERIAESRTRVRGSQGSQTATRRATGAALTAAAPS